MDPDRPFRIQLRKVDKDEFTTYRWGELEGGEIVKTYEEGEDRFGSFADIVEYSTDLFADGTDPSIPIPWLKLWHNYGSQAHYPRADVLHPYIDRHLWGEDGIVLTGALRGLVAPSSHVEIALLNPMAAWGSLFESLFEVVICGGQLRAHQCPVA